MELSEVRHSYLECPTMNISTIRIPASYKILLQPLAGPMKKKKKTLRKSKLSNSNGQQTHINGQIVKLVSNQSEKHTLLVK